LFDFDCVCSGSFRSFLVRNWSGRGYRSDCKMRICDHILVLAVLMLFSALLSAKVDLIVIPSPSFGVDCFGLWRRHWPSNRRSIELTSRSGEKYNGSWLGWVSRENLRAI
jgi:hypothetical protein